MKAFHSVRVTLPMHTRRTTALEVRSLNCHFHQASNWENERYVVTMSLQYMGWKLSLTNVFGHRTMKISHPVRSAVNKHRIDRLVLQWVTMWESRLLNSCFFCFSCCLLTHWRGMSCVTSVIVRRIPIV